MASQITHVLYGKKIFERHPGLSWPDFLIGTLFPDIRYLAKIDRNKLHKFNTSEEMIPKDSSFKAGMYVHWLGDEKREKFISEKGIYGLLPKEQYISAAIKLIEDKLVYDSIDNWEEIINTLGTYPKEEEGFGIGRKILENWHNLLKKYFRQKPDLETWREMILSLGFDRELSESVLSQTKIIQANKKAVGIIKAIFEII